MSPENTQRASRPTRHQHHVYVVELVDQVWNEASFRKANPDHQLGKPFVYVGMTGLDPDLRFDKHKAGIQANRFVLECGLRLLPALYAVYNPMPYEAAREMEQHRRGSCSRACQRANPRSPRQACRWRAHARWKGADRTRWPVDANVPSSTRETPG